MNQKSVSRCDCTPVVGTRFGGESGRPPSITIIEAVAAAENIAPTELDPLGEEIDLKAIDRLFREQGETSTSPKLLRCSVAGWNVFVRGDGAIRVCDPNRITEPESAFEKAICD
ncbi:hypothetical protein BRC91_13045 [Halobacteriales archaeon QS_4_62_28]|nr:MAG: hypothetical protein BRC91_13045 [Halobacteriales archaeon QS_4_62_28]